MPSLPEIGDVDREVWMTKVSHELEPEQVGRAPRHLAVASEIVVDLDAVQDETAGKRDGGVRAWIGGVAVGERPRGVGDHHLANEPDAEQRETARPSSSVTTRGRSI